MTPKEKAKELVEKYLPEVQGADRYNYNVDDMNIYIAKQCAKIAVDEIIDTFIPKTKPDFTCYEIEYWKEVKQEIELL